MNLLARAAWMFNDSLILYGMKFIIRAPLSYQPIIFEIEDNYEIYVGEFSIFSQSYVQYEIHTRFGVNYWLRE